MKELAIRQHTAAALGNIPSLNGYREHTSRFSRGKGERVHILLIIESQKHITEVPWAGTGVPKAESLSLKCALSSKIAIFGGFRGYYGPHKPEVRLGPWTPIAMTPPPSGRNFW